MTGRDIPIVTVSALEHVDGKTHTILVGPSRLTDAMGVKVNQKQDDGDHYIIRTSDDKPWIALVGNDAGSLRGTIYAVYDLLERLGCGWYAPDPKWHVIPKRETLAIEPLNVDVRPAFKHREIWMVVNAPIKDAWRLGGVHFAHGHALEFVLPREEYEKDHPDWFGPYQPSLTNPDVIKTIAERFRKTLDEKWHGDIVSLNLCANDGAGFAKADLKEGNVSSQMLYFANELSKELQKTHAGKYQLTFYAYWYSHDAPEPMRKAEPGVAVMQVSEGDHLKPWDWPEDPKIAATTGRNNTREVKAFEAWKATGAEMAIYEWWIPNVGDRNWGSVPWYPLETSLRNYRYWKNGGVTAITHESQNETSLVRRWPLYYLGARSMWEPDLSAEEILMPACRKLFGPAAGHMFDYYQTFEKATLASKLVGWNWYLPSPELIYTPEYVAEADEHLNAALSMTQDADMLARIQEEKALWDQSKQLIADLRQNSPQRYFPLSLDGKVMWAQELKVVSGDYIHSLFGFSEYAPVYSVLPDGSKRQITMDEEIDLTRQNAFSLQP